MYIHNCPQCGKQYSTEERVNRVKCPYCGAETDVVYNGPQPPQQPPYQQQGYQQQQQGYQQPPYQQPQYAYQQPQSTGNIFDEGPSGKSRGLAGLLAILLGSLGVHYFYLGKSTGGIVFLLVAIFSCGFLAAVTAIVSLIQGIMMFTCSQEEFERKWVNCPTSFPLF